MTKYKVISENTESTVVSEYTPAIKKSDSFQSESDLERELIHMLEEQGYERLVINSEEELIKNLRNKIEELNDYKFSDTEWDSFFTQYLANSNDHIEEKTRTIQEDSTKAFRRDDGSIKNICLLDKSNVHANSLQVINQYENEGNFENRYDVTILVNGLPLVHIELKKRGVSIKEAFNQIERYQKDSFWAGSGLYEYVQIFVISNGTNTKYYSNTTRHSHTEEMKNGKRGSKKTSHSFEFTSYWADANNKVITDLIDFTKTFLIKRTILNIICRYCVFTSEKLLLVMRPYQIAACEKIINTIEIANNYKYYGSLEGGGYIWHTTGSGKTLTSFKTAQLATKLSYIDKVLFVVDRKDLDYQTMKEYDRFEKGAANSNKSTSILKRQLEDDNCRIIITTIQKLDIFVRKNKGHEIFNKRVVLIFDECHRSQFGDFHEDITKAFKKYNIFGFTGTPIFAENAGQAKNPKLATTVQAFGKQLHAYTIIDAINDGNVLPFKVDIVRTIVKKHDINDENVSDINRDKALLAPERIKEIVTYIREHFNQKTKHNELYKHSVITNVKESAKNRDKEIKETKNVAGFNSILATQSIEFAKAYYKEFKEQQKDLPEGLKLKVAIIFSYGVNEDPEADIIFDDENSDDTEQLDKSSRDFLEDAIMDYNLMFKTNYDTSSDKFSNYYKDVSMRMKNNEIDILIVVNMFLTGFDATTLNTLWVDKNLKYHGLIQSFSRTNRILNSIKTFGNIVCFRNLEERVNEALALFGNKDAGGIVLLRPFEDYYNGWDENANHFPGYKELVDELNNNFPLYDPSKTFEQYCFGETKEKKFIATFGALLKSMNILNTFDEFEGKELMDDRMFQDYQSKYQDLYDKYRRKSDADKEDINDDIVFEIELVKQFEVNVDYILALVEEYMKTGKTDKEIISKIRSALGSGMSLRSKVKLIEDFIENLQGEDVRGSWQSYLDKRIVDDLDQIVYEEELDQEKTRRFVDDSLKTGRFDPIGTSISTILPPVSMFGKSDREGKKKRVIEKLSDFFNRYWDLGVDLADALLSKAINKK